MDKGRYLTLEEAKKLANYDKLIAKNTELKTNNELLKNLIKDKDKTIETLRKQIKDMQEEYKEKFLIEEQIRMKLK